MIFRPVALRIEEAVRGTVVHNPTTVRWIGGQAGCEFAAVEAGASPNLVDGGRYLFFLGMSIDAGGQRGTDLMILDAWPISPADLVSTPLEGEVPLTSVATTANAAPTFPDSNR
jgi:hypothetical protein